MKIDVLLLLSFFAFTTTGCKLFALSKTEQFPGFLNAKKKVGESAYTKTKANWHSRLPKLQAEAKILEMNNKKVRIKVRVHSSDRRATDPNHYYAFLIDGRGERLRQVRYELGREWDYCDGDPNAKRAPVVIQKVLDRSGRMLVRRYRMNSGPRCRGSYWVREFTLIFDSNYDINLYGRKLTLRMEAFGIGYQLSWRKDVQRLTHIEKSVGEEGQKRPRKPKKNISKKHLNESQKNPYLKKNPKGSEVSPDDESSEAIQ